MNVLLEEVSIVICWAYSEVIVLTLEFDGASGNVDLRTFCNL